MIKEMKKSEEDEEREEIPLYGDILDSIVSKLPTPSLLTSSHVSSTWRLAVASSLRRQRRPKPLLLLHLPLALTLAFDPHSHSWDPLPLPRTPLTCPSLFPHRATWQPHLPSPAVSRVDPVLALAGTHLIAAGGTCDFEDRTCAVEVLDLSSPRPSWSHRDPLPSPFHQSSSATWLSSATSPSTLYLLDKDSSLFSSFDPITGHWSRTCELKPDPLIYLSAIAYSDNRLVLAGLSGSDTVRLRVWEVGLDPIRFREMGSMPEEMVEALRGEGFCEMTRVGFGLVGDYGYFWNPVDFREGAVFWEIEEDRWTRVECPEEVEDNPMAKIVFGIAKVGFTSLRSLFGQKI